MLTWSSKLLPLLLVCTDILCQILLELCKGCIMNGGIQCLHHHNGLGAQTQWADQRATRYIAVVQPWLVPVPCVPCFSRCPSRGYMASCQPRTVEHQGMNRQSRAVRLTGVESRGRAYTSRVRRTFLIWLNSVNLTVRLVNSAH